MNNDHLHTLLSTKNKIHNTQKGHFLKYFYLESVLTFAKLFSLSTSSTNEYIVIFQHISICHLQQICNKLLFFCCLQTPKRPFYKASRTPYLSRLFIVGTLFVVLSYSTKLVLILLNSPYSNYPPYFIFLLYFESLCGQMM